jgi:homopolymeric O-antigen transport system permease protein
MTTAAAGLRVIEPSSGWAPIGWRELWDYRELFGFLVWRDVKVRYKQTVLGAAWAMLQPLTTMAMFAVLFGRWAKMPSDGVPYPLFAFAALLPWTFFANAVAAASVSLVGNTHLISKVYFPRLLISLASLGTGLVDFAIALVLMFAMCVVYGVPPSGRLLMLPIVMLVAFMAAAGAGSFLAALCGVYRDVRYVVPLLMQLWMFASPVIYPASLVPPRWLWLYHLNPMSGVISGFRSAMLGLPMPWRALTSAAIVSVALAWIGASYFRRVERRVADLL